MDRFPDERFTCPRNQIKAPRHQPGVFLYYGALAGVLTTQYARNVRLGGQLPQRAGIGEARPGSGPEGCGGPGIDPVDQFPDEWFTCPRNQIKAPRHKPGAFFV